MKTEQETFDAVYQAILNQGCLSKNENGQCFYRGSNGTKCAAGCLIPDNCYDPKMENGICLQWRVVDVLQKEGYNPGFVYLLQTIHDTSKDFNDWKQQMIEFAIKYGLLVP